MEKLSIIIPAYNEEKTIKEILAKIKKVKVDDVAKEIIVVDDCSYDKTGEILKSDSSIKAIFHKKNMGKGSAVRTGIDNSTGDIIIIQDADLEYEPKEYPKILNPIFDEQCDVVYGTRLQSIISNPKEMNKLHYAGNLFLTFLTNLLYNSNITDMETGYKAFRRSVIKNITLKSRRFDFEPEITAKILKKGYKICEVPITFNPRKFSEGKKITLIDGIKAAFYLIKYRFVD